MGDVGGMDFEVDGAIGASVTKLHNPYGLCDSVDDLLLSKGGRMLWIPLQGPQVRDHDTHTDRSTPSAPLARDTHTEVIAPWSSGDQLTGPPHNNNEAVWCV